MIRKNPLIVFIILFAIFLFSCSKKPYSTAADGWVICADDSTAIGDAKIKVAHWDGSQKSDTDFVFTSKADTNGRFSFVFESEDNNDFFWVLAERSGYNNSSWETLDGGFSNSVIIKMDTIE